MVNPLTKRRRKEQTTRRSNKNSQFSTLSVVKAGCQRNLIKPVISNPPLPTVPAFVSVCTCTCFWFVYFLGILCVQVQISLLCHILPPPSQYLESNQIFGGITTPNSLSPPNRFAHFNQIRMHKAFSLLRHQRDKICNYTSSKLNCIWLLFKMIMWVE